MKPIPRLPIRSLRPLALVLCACAAQAADSLLSAGADEGLRLDLSRELTHFSNPNRQPWRAQTAALSLPLPALRARVGLGVSRTERFAQRLDEWTLTGAHQINALWGAELAVSNAPPGGWRPSWGGMAQLVRRLDTAPGSPWPDRLLVGARLDNAPQGNSKILNAGLEWERSAWGLELAGKAIRDATGGMGQAYAAKLIWVPSPGWKLNLGHVNSQEYEAGRPISVHANTLALHWQLRPTLSLSSYVTREWRSDTGRSQSMALAWTWQP